MNQRRGDGLGGALLLTVLDLAYFVGNLAYRGSAMGRASYVAESVGCVGLDGDVDGG